MKKTRKGIVAAAMAALVIATLAFSLGGCKTPTPAPAPVSPESTGTQDIDLTGLGNVVAAPESAIITQSGRTATVPEVRSGEDGTLYQRTPSEYPESKEWGYTTLEDEAGTYAFNIQALDADNRGCIACHEDLGATCNAIGYTHFDMTNDRGIEITVDMCLDCHHYQPLSTMPSDYYNFKELMHGIHTAAKGFTGNCFSCHVQVGDDDTMYLWDKRKYDVLRGVVDLYELDGEFDWSQGMVFTRDEWFDFNWLYTEYDFDRQAKDVAGEEIDPQVMADWTITVSGAVEHEMTFNLKELIDAGLSETRLIVAVCTMNPQGGPFIGNFTVTGIPLDILFEQCGISEDAIGFYPLCSDGYYGYMNLLEDYHGALLVYEIDGQTVSWKEGYPVVYWQMGGCAGNNTKQVTDFIFATELPEEPLDTNGNLTEEGWAAAYEGLAKDQPEYFTAKPQVGIYDNISGRIVEVGKPYTFTGYAFGYDEDIASIDISMDNGETWTSFETPNPDPSLLVDWSYTFTPETRGSYLLMVKATTASGMTCTDPVYAMITAKEA